jgi:predicted signal transduction protein with EAL and GGDEF domain
VVAARLLRCQREEDTVARLSGDEFAVLLPHLATAGDVMVVAQRVLAALAPPVTIAGARMLITASIGIAVHPNDGDSADDVLSSADAARYRAKETPGNTCEIFSSALATQAHERRRLESALYAGVQRNELTLYYQPVVDLASGRTVGVEALVRWMHPEDGLVLPGQFIPVAEQSDLIVLLGERVILHACEQLRRWADLGLRDLSVAVNVSSRHFNHGLVSTVTAALRDTGADARNLVIELTESTAVDNLDAVAAALDELRSLGVRSAIDDFGTGYCGLRYLSTLPVDCLKIDQSFIQGMTPSAAAIVAATIAMGHSLGLTLIAEGVETAEQHRFLLTQGCDRVQGYLFGRPMPADALTDRLRAERALDLVDPPGEAWVTERGVLAL